MGSVDQGEQNKQLDALVRQIVVYDRKNFDKKQYVLACEQFQEKIASAGVLSELDEDWRELVRKFLAVLPNKNLGTDLRRMAAKCIGTIGVARVSHYSEYLECLFAAFNKALPKYFEERTMILCAVCDSLNLIGASSPQLLSDMKPIEEAMKFAKKVLEANESHVVLNPLLDICLAVAKYFPAVFRDEFSDVLDFTVGWYTELDQPAEVSDKCSQVIVELKPYFHQSINSSIELMMQFVDDAKVYVEELNQKDVKCDVSLQKTALLLRSLATILSVFDSPEMLAYLLPFAEKVFVEMNYIVKFLSEFYLNEVGSVFLEMIRVYWSLLQISTRSPELESSIEAVVLMLKHPSCTIKILTKLLDFFEEVFDKLPPDMTSSILPAVFASLIDSRYKHSKLIWQFMSKLLTPRSLPTLQAAYKCARERFLACFALMKEAAEGDDGLKAKRVEEDAILFLRAFATLAGAKNSLIGMIGLFPSLFTMLSDETPLVEKWFIVGYPSCHLALLHVLKLHCERHDNFIANSVWFNDKKHSLIMQEGLTSNHLTRTVVLLSELLQLSPYMWSDTRDSVLDWVRGIAFGTSHEMLQQILNLPEVVVLRKALLQSFLHYTPPKKLSLESPKRSFAVNATRVRLYTLLRRLSVFDLVQEDVSCSDFGFIRNVFDVVKRSSREMAISLWQTIPPPLFISCGLSQSFKREMEFSQEKIVTALFTSDHFKIMTDFLLKSVIPTYLLNDTYDDRWMEDVVSLIYSSATNDCGPRTSHIEKWRWVLAQTAQYCIDNRMRTPLGKPLETFLCFEKEIRNLAFSALSSKTSSATEASNKSSKPEKEETIISKLIIVNRSRRTVGDEDEEENESVQEQRQLSDAEQWWRVRALLETIELLDKFMSYAGDGTIYQLSNVSQPSRQFFITNAASCSSWLSRMYLLTMAVAYRNGNYAQVVRLGGCALRDAQKRSNSPVLQETNGKESDSNSLSKSMDVTTFTCLSWMTRALIELGGSQAILGLYAWTKKMYCIDYEWLTYAADMACGRIEQSIDGLMKCATDENLPENASKIVRQLMITGLNMLRSPEELTRVWRGLNNSDGSKEPQLNLPPNGFENAAWERTKKLVTFPPQNAATENLSVVWDMDSRFQCMELKLMDIARSFNKNGRIDLLRRLGEDAQMLLLADTNSKMLVKASVLHVLASNLKDNHKSDPLALSDTMDSLSFRTAEGSPLEFMVVCQQLSEWMESCRFENGLGPSVKIFGDEPSFHLNACSLARKLGNLRSANRHLLLYRSKLQPNAKLLPHQNGWPPGFEEESFAGLVNGVYNPFSSGIEDRSNSKLVSARVAAKLLDSQGVAQPIGSSCASAFAMLYDSISDEVDRLLFKANALFNGTPTVAPNALTVVLTHQLMLSNAEQTSSGLNGVVSKGFARKNPKKNTDNLLSRAILNLAEWLGRDPSLVNVALSRSSRISWHMFGVELSNLPPPLNPASGLVGSLLSAACKLSFHLAKAHARFADWAYKCIHMGDDDSTGMTFTDDERAKMTWDLKLHHPSLANETVEALIQAVGKAEQLTVLKEDVCSILEEACGKEVSVEKHFGADSVLIEKWAAARSRTVAYVISCVHSYFAFISEFGANAGKESSIIQGSIGTVVASLRILQLFMKYSEALQAIVDEEFLRTNESIWKDILPQLFARLNHPVPAVRNSLCILLERISEKAPHALCYPAIVGATKPVVVLPAEEINAKNEEFYEDLVDEERKMKVEADRSLMCECCQRIVSRLSQMYPELVANVSEFVQELQRINMLFEERWIFVLANLDHEMSRRITQIESEKARTLASTHLNPKEQQAIIKEKTVILSEMVFRIMEALYERTFLREPSTVNERHFRDTYFPQLSAAFEAYCTNKHEPKKAWQPFKQLLVTLTQRSSKRGALTLSTSDVSPKLCAMKSTRIPMPGQELKEFSEVVTIEQITKQAIVLPTKTRPKKISFVGSDGKEYPFLFKGQEDLHLDERIMQLLRICNLMLSEKENEWPSYSAKHYSVTPLGSRSGLIQWVDGAIPLFHVYRKWQTRKAANSNSKKESVEVDRPSELFFRKLKAAFSANNISADVLTDRQKWPLQLLEDVVAELMKETPSDLLSRELWMRSGSSDTWYRITERFARSSAVMSMLGSVLGLGDRHLDNVLVNLESGQVIHIDYNVCFDKGRNLRVPETVPFRLTNNIVHALGPTQIEGTFRLSCEHMLMRLRAGKEVLLTILDTFVYDPLVDWAAAQEQLITSGNIGVATLLAVYGTEPYTGSALPLIYSLFALRVKEFGVPWRANGDRLHYALLRLTEALEKTHRSREGILDYGSMVKGKAPGEEDVKLIEKERSEASAELKQSISEHKRLMHDFRPLLRSLAYNDEKFREYLQTYKELFMEPLLKGCNLFDSGEEEEFSAVALLFHSVNDQLDSVYDKLLALNKKDEKVAIPSSRPTSKPAQEFEGRAASRKQEQNVYAKNVSMRIKQKLEGKEAYLYRSKSEQKSASSEKLVEKEPLSFAEQADTWIQQATSLSNLALMYEGWTAWV